MVNVAILGYGTIGSGVYKVICENADVIAKNAGTEIKVKRVLDLREFPGDPVEPILTHDFNDILNDDEIDIVAEVMGGTGAAYEFAKASLEAGKSVVTSNKALVAAYGPELIAIAKEKNINFMFEASVGGGIPIIRPLTKCLTADRITEISGILNGTTNYILTAMEKEAKTFDEALAEAQANGYAEADPAADIDGHDPSRKIAILGALAEGRFIDFQDIPCEGITKISERDFFFAKRLGCRIKLLATYRNVDGTVFADVSPVMISLDNPLASVDGVMNAVKVTGNMLGDVMFYGAGAGSLPTGSAVVSDIIVEARHLQENVEIKMDREKLILGAPEKEKDVYFIRADRECNVKFNIPVDLMMDIPGYEDEYEYITEEIEYGRLKEKLDALEGIRSVIKIR